MNQALRNWLLLMAAVVMAAAFVTFSVDAAASTLPQAQRTADWLAGILDPTMLRTIGITLITLGGVGICFGVVRSMVGLRMIGGLMIAGAAATIYGFVVS